MWRREAGTPPTGGAVIRRLTCSFTAWTAAATAAAADPSSSQ